MSVPKKVDSIVEDCFRDLCPRRTGQDANEDGYNKAQFMLLDAHCTTKRLYTPGYCDAQVSIAMWQLMERASRDERFGEAHRELEILFSPCEDLDAILDSIISQTPELRAVTDDIPSVENAKLFTVDFKLPKITRHQLLAKRRPDAQTPPSTLTRAPLVDGKLNVVHELCDYTTNLVALLGQITRDRERLKRVCERVRLYMEIDELYEGRATLSAGGILTMLYFLRASLVHGLREGVLSHELALRALRRYVVWIALLPESSEIGLHGIYTNHIIWNVLRPSVPFAALSREQRVTYRMIRKRCMALMTPITNAIGTYSDEINPPPDDDSSERSMNARAEHYVRRLAGAFGGCCQNFDCTCVDAQIRIGRDTLPSREYRLGKDLTSMIETTWIFQRFRRSVGPAPLLDAVLAGDLSECRSKIMRTVWVYVSRQAMALDISSTGIKKRECGNDSGKVGALTLSPGERDVTARRRRDRSYVISPKPVDFGLHLRAAWHAPRRRFDNQTLIYHRIMTPVQSHFLERYTTFWASSRRGAQHQSFASRKHRLQSNRVAHGNEPLAQDDTRDVSGVALVNALLDTDVSLSPLSSPAPIASYAVPVALGALSSQAEFSPHFQQAVQEAFRLDAVTPLRPSTAPKAPAHVSRGRPISLPPSWPSPL